MRIIDTSNVSTGYPLQDWALALFKREGDRRMRRTSDAILRRKDE